MQKIISLFKRNYDGDHLVRDEVVEEAEWVLKGEGVATRKYDGTCCMVKDQRLFKRYELKKDKTAPVGFCPAQDPDPITGDQPGWVEVGISPEDRWFREAWDQFRADGRVLQEGTYELCGPKINKNPDEFSYHILVPHGADVLHDCPREFNMLKGYLTALNIEGIVWHHPDGRMVKIKKRDFGLKRK